MKTFKNFAIKVLSISIITLITAQLSLANPNACLVPNNGFPLSSNLVFDTADTVAEASEEPMVCAPADEELGEVGPETCASCGEVKEKYREQGVPYKKLSDAETARIAIKTAAEDAVKTTVTDIKDTFNPQNYWDLLRMAGNGVMSGVSYVAEAGVFSTIGATLGIAGEELGAIANAVGSAAKGEASFAHAWMNHPRSANNYFAKAIKTASALASQAFGDYQCSPPSVQVEIASKIITVLGLNLVFMAAPLGAASVIWKAGRKGQLGGPLEKVFSGVTKAIADVRMKYGINHLLKAKYDDARQLAKADEIAKFNLAKAKGQTPKGIFVSKADDGKNLVMAEIKGKIYRLDGDNAEVQKIARLSRESRLLDMEPNDRIEWYRSAQQAKRNQKKLARNAKQLRRETNRSLKTSPVKKSSVPRDLDFGDSGVAVHYDDGKQFTFVKRRFGGIAEVTDSTSASKLADLRKQEAAAEAFVRQIRSGLPASVAAKGNKALANSGTMGIYARKLQEKDSKALYDGFQDAIKPARATNAVNRQLKKADPEIYRVAQAHFGKVFGENAAAHIGAEARRIAGGNTAIATAKLDQTAVTFMKHPEAAEDLFRTYRNESSAENFAEILTALEKNAERAVPQDPKARFFSSSSRKPVTPETAMARARRNTKVRGQVARKVSGATRAYQTNAGFRRVVTTHTAKLRKTSPDVDASLVSQVGKKGLDDNGVKGAGDLLDDIGRSCRI